MTVKHILESKGRDVVSLDASRTIGEAIRTLSERRIGALVCTGEGRSVFGIVSERDIVRIVASHGAAALELKLSDVMTKDVTVGHEAMTLDEAMELMTRGRFRHLPICEEGALVGIVSIGDAVKRRIEDVTREAEDLRTYIHTS